MVAKTLILICCTFTIVSAKVKIGNEYASGDISYRSDALKLLRLSFDEHQIDYLNKISTSGFMKSKFFLKLKEHALHDHLNLNHLTKIAVQGFEVDSNKNLLFIEFDSSKQTGMWRIKDAYFANNRPGEDSTIQERGFLPIQIDDDFSGLVRIIENKDIDDFLGLAPYGKLNKSFLIENKLFDVSNESSVLIKNMIIHDNKKIVDMVFVKLKYHEIGHKEPSGYKSGWLIVDGGSMSEFYGDDLYVSFLQNRKSLAIKKIIAERNKNHTSIKLGPPDKNSTVHYKKSRHQSTKNKYEFVGLKHREEYIHDFSRMMSISHVDSSAFLNYIADMIENIEYNLKIITSKSAKNSKKDTAIHNILKYFDKVSYIYTSSSKMRRARYYYSSVYLNRLKRLDFNKTKLYFDINGLRFGDISKIKGKNGTDGFMFNLNPMLSSPTCRKNASSCYRDFTQNNFSIVIYKDKDGMHLDLKTLRIKSIKASKAPDQKAVFR